MKLSDFIQTTPKAGYEKILYELERFPKDQCDLSWENCDKNFITFYPKLHEVGIPIPLDTPDLAIGDVIYYTKVASLPENQYESVYVKSDVLKELGFKNLASLIMLKTYLKDEQLEEFFQTIKDPKSFFQLIYTDYNSYEDATLLGDPLWEAKRYSLGHDIPERDLELDIYLETNRPILIDPLTDAIDLMILLDDEINSPSFKEIVLKDYFKRVEHILQSYKDLEQSLIQLQARER